MKTLDRYILRETLPPFLLALGLFTFLLAIRPMLDNAQSLLAKGVHPPEVAFLLLTLVPQALGLTIPMAFLCGALMGLGRLSGDREAVAMLACGVSPVQLLRPLILFAVVAGAADVYTLTTLVPNSNQRFREETFHLLVNIAEGDIKPGLFYRGFPGKVLYVREGQPGGGWSGVFLAETSQSGPPIVTMASAGYLDIDQVHKVVAIVLPGEFIRYAPGDTSGVYEMVRSRDLRLEVPPDTVFGTGQIQRGRAEMTIADLRKEEARRRAQGLSPHNEIMQRHQMFSFPVACLAFALVGLALGLHTRKEGKLGGFALGIGVLFVYYALMQMADSLTKGGHFPAAWSRWVPDIVVGALGVAAVWWRNTSAGRELTVPIPAWIRPASWFKGRRQHASGSAAPSPIVLVIRVPNLSLPRPRLLDLYVARRYLGVVTLSFVGFLGLYYISTLIDKTEHIVKGDANLWLLIKYFYYSTPQYVVYIVPMATLVAVLATIGGLTKTSELVVMRACGVSLYRVAAPLLLLAAVWAGALFLLDDRVLAKANEKANDLDLVIRGVAPQPTNIVSTASWLVDPSGRIYYYTLFDVPRRTLHGLTVFETVRAPFHLASETTVASAVFTRGTTWRADSGWTERFPTADRTTHQAFGPGPLDLVAPDYFIGTAPDDPTLMTFGDLRRHITKLAQSGFSLSNARVELYQRIAFPVVTLVMTLLAVPFGVTTGRRGALYGIGLACILGTGYWLVNVLFLAVGDAALLPPMLAAWSANLLFLAVAGYLILTVRT